MQKNGATKPLTNGDDTAKKENIFPIADTSKEEEQFGYRPLLFVGSVIRENVFAKIGSKRLK